MPKRGFQPSQTIHQVKGKILRNLSWYRCQCGFEYIDSATNPGDQSCPFCDLEVCRPQGYPIYLESRIQ